MDQEAALLSEKQFKDSNRTIVENKDTQIVTDEVKIITVRVYSK